MMIVSSRSCQLIQAAMPKQTMHLERFEQRLAEQPLHALADRVEVGGAAIHEVAAAGLGEVGHIEPQHLAIELHPQVVADEVAEPRDDDAVPDAEHAFHDRANDARTGTRPSACRRAWWAASGGRRGRSSRNVRRARV